MNFDLMIRGGEINFAVNCRPPKVVQNRIHMWNGIPVHNRIPAKCAKVDAHTLGTILLFHKEDRMIVLGPARLNPSICQQLINLALGLIKFSLRQAVLFMVWKRGIRIQKLNVVLDTVFNRLLQWCKDIQKVSTDEFPFRFACQLSYLGHVIKQGTITMEPQKVDAISNWPTPTSKKELQTFLGLANYYAKFVRHFATLAAPLH